MVLALVACGDDDGAAGLDAAADAAPLPDAAVDAGPPPLPSPDPCDRVLPGPAGSRAPAVDLSAAHAAVRFHGLEPASATGSGFRTADVALAAALDGDDPLGPAALDTYAAGLVTVCSLDATDAELGPATVTVQGDVAVVRPGTGPVSLPEDVRAVAVDLRGLPAVPGLREALAAAVAPALATPVSSLQRRVRFWQGLDDEVFAEANAYTQTLRATASSLLVGPAGSVDLPLAVLTDATLAPEAAELALTLRLGQRAWVLGEDLLTAVAELHWFGVGEAGLAVRTHELRWDGDRAPDAVPADARTADPLSLLAALPDDPPGAVALGPAVRPAVEVVDTFQDARPEAAGAGVARAALIASHGALRTFYPYFATVGDRLDDRLLEVLATADATDTGDRRVVRNLIRRLGESVSDGHHFVFDHHTASAGCLPLVLGRVAGEVLVLRSTDASVLAGDRLETLDDAPLAAWLDEELARSGGATDGYRFSIAVRELGADGAPFTLGVRDPGGTLRSVTMAVGSCATAPWAESGRSNGWLDDLGAPTVYYLNLDGEVTSTIQAARDAIAAAELAAGIVLDMRGYPGVDHYEVAARLVPQPFFSPIFRTPQLLGLELKAVDEQEYALDPQDAPSYPGPVVLLVGNQTVSAAENLSIMLVDAGRVTVVGRRSAGTNGNITGAELPGGYALTFTGMEILHHDRSVFHGVGIVPDVEVAPTPAGLAAGEDADVEAALDLILGP
jgi:hypothetical protein